MTSRDSWLEAAKRLEDLVSNVPPAIRCPERDDDVLRIEWMAAAVHDPSGRGEYRLWCPTCGAENFALVAYRLD